MKKLLLIIIMFFFLFSCSPEKTNKIRDGLIEKYELAFSYSGYFLDALYLEKNNISLDDIYKDLNSQKYNVKYSNDYDGKTCLIVEYFINDKNRALFIIEDGTKYQDDVFCVRQMILGKKNVYFSFPISCVCYCNGLEIYEGNVKITSAYIVNKSYDELLYFYQNQSLCEIKDYNLEEKTIIVEAVDKKIGKELNCYVKIYYKAYNDLSYITFDIL